MCAMDLSTCPWPLGSSKVLRMRESHVDRCRCMPKILEIMEDVEIVTGKYTGKLNWIRYT